MNRTTPADQWPIYNCHIHTFTRKHTPRHFIKYVISDRELGRINPLKIAFFVLLFIPYIASIFIVGNFILLLSASLNGVNLPVYAVLLLLEVLLTVPLVIFAFLVLALIVLLLAQAVIDALARRQPEEQRGPWMDRKSSVQKMQEMVAHPNIVVDLLAWIIPTSSNDIFDRIARFLKIAARPSQEAFFLEIQRQYQTKDVKTRFVVLPMGMTHMKLGELEESIELQHEQLLSLAECYQDQIIPFYAVDPCQPGVVDKVYRQVLHGPFRGIKIYPNLGYAPNHPVLMDIYGMCVEGDIPVMTHCSPGGVWQYGITEKKRREYSRPESYQCVFEKYRTLKLCLAHFGGAQEWARRLKPEMQKDKYPDEEPWVRTIYDMIADGEYKYPNLYTDISYTAFTPSVNGLYIDLVDYLKVMLSHPRVRTRVLFGSDYYMVAQEKISEKEASILLRSRLGEDLYKQIAYTNPREYLGETHRAKASHAIPDYLFE